MKSNDKKVSRFQLILIERSHLSNEIIDILKQNTVPTILIDEFKNFDDITNYIQNNIRKSRIFKKMFKELRTLITKTFIERADEMFL